MKYFWRLLVPIGSFGLFLEGMAWYEAGPFRDGLAVPYLASVSDPGQIGPLRSDPEHYDEMGRYMWWGC